MTEAARTAWRTSDSPAALSAATVHSHHFTSMRHKEIRKMLRNIGHALITLAATLVAGAVSAQFGPVPRRQPLADGRTAPSRAMFK